MALVIGGPNMLKLVTFNIRCDYDQDKGNSFRYRKSLILNQIQKEKPDLICFQEVLPHVAAWLKDVLEDYYVVGCGRSETLEDEQVAVAYKKKRLNLISMETFWLSLQPYRPASRYEEQSICPRVCTETLFEDLEEKQVFRLLNLHLDHQGVQARILGLRQVLKKAEEAKLFPEAPVILAGDFNAEPEGEEFLEIKQHPEYRNITDGIGITYHGFEPEDEPERIDYIFIRNLKGESTGLRCRSVNKWEEREDGVWLSDHYPVCALLEWI